jgi:hypothetical protein
MYKELDNYAHTRELQFDHIYIDNPNVYIKSYKAFDLTRKLYVSHDLSWRDTPSQLKEALIRQSQGLGPKDITFDFTLYGTTSPEAENMWAAMDSNDVGVRSLSQTNERKLRERWRRGRYCQHLPDYEYGHTEL